jgi:hypothetical protein
MKLSLIVAFFVPAAAHKMNSQESVETVLAPAESTTWTREVGSRCMPEVLTIRTQTTPDQCRALCLADPNCISYDTVSTVVTTHSTWCIPNCPGGSCNDLCTASLDTPRALTSTEINNCGSCTITSDREYYRWVRNPAPVLTTLPPTTSSTTTMSDLELLQASYTAQAESWCKDGNGEGQYAVEHDGTCTSTSTLPEASASCSSDVSEAEKCMKFTHRNYGTDKSFAWREQYLDGAFHRACIVCVDKAISESTAGSNNLGGYTLYTPKTTTR